MIGDMCTKPVVTVAPDASVLEAARLMKSKNVGALVIANAGKPLGILTDRDIAVGVVAAGSDPATTKVADAMHAAPAVIRENEGFFDTVKMLGAKGVRRLPVVNKTGKLVGIIALDDVLMLLGDEMTQVSTALSHTLRRPPAAA